MGKNNLPVDNSNTSITLSDESSEECLHDRNCNNKTPQKRKPYCHGKGVITTNPFLNFLRVFRSKHCGWSRTKIAIEGAREWLSLPDCIKNIYRKQACNAAKSHAMKSKKTCKNETSCAPKRKSKVRKKRNCKSKSKVRFSRKSCKKPCEMPLPPLCPKPCAGAGQAAAAGGASSTSFASSS